MRGRRHFLAGLGASAFAPHATWAEAGRPAALSAARDASGAYVLIGLCADGSIAFQQPLPARGHAAAAHPHVAEAVQVARRPGDFALVIDCVTGAVTHRLTAPTGRHFYGHAAFTADGARLLTTENDIETGRGVIGVWDRAGGYRRIAELPSGGIGPHEIIRLPSGGFAVANGGIRTHPATGRQKLNLDTMRANLTFLDSAGEIAASAEAPDPQNSLRHIAAMPDGTVICGFQWQGDVYDAPPLVALFREGALTPAPVPEATQRALKGYIGSVAATGAGWMASAPRGGLVLHGAADRVTAHRVPDGCGLADLGDTALVTDGLGHVSQLNGGALQRRAAHPLAFDNHLVRI